MRARRNSKPSQRAAFVLSAMVAFCRVAAAEPENLRIDYVAPTGCPDAAAFLRLLRERTTRFREAAPSEQARRFLVRVTAVGSSFSGRLEIESPDGSTAIRSVDASACDEVSSALALMTALAIDPNAVTRSQKAAPEISAKPSSDPAAESERPDSPEAEVAVVAWPPPAAETRSDPWRWSVGLSGQTTFVVSPALAYGGDLFVEAEAPASSRFGPAVRAGVFFAQCDVDLPSGAGARFQWAAAAILGCPVRLDVMTSRLTVHPCLALRLGVLRGEGQRISQPKQTVGLWADAGPVLRLRLALTERWILEVQGALVLPLSRPSFEILDMGSPTTAYSVPSVGGSAGIGVAYRFR